MQYRQSLIGKPSLRDNELGITKIIKLRMVERIQCMLVEQELIT
jgi:hypothetical protein